MSEQSLHTAELHGWLDRFKAGDEGAIDTLLRRVSGRLEALSRKMLRRFPRVARWADAEDILQNATLRLVRALREVRPGSMREFYALASTQVRRELLDVTKQLYGPHGEAANHASINPADSAAVRIWEPQAAADDDRELDKWCHFHQQVEKLPVEEREVVGLIFYHAWKQEQVAELFGVTVRTVQRWWRSALSRLQDVLCEWPIKD